MPSGLLILLTHSSGPGSIACATWYQEGDEWMATSPTYTAYFCAASSTYQYAYQTYEGVSSSNTSQPTDPEPTRTTPSVPDTSGSTKDEANDSAESSPAPSETFPSDPASSKSNTAAIAGGTVGGVAVLAIVVGGIIAWLKHKKKREREEKVPEVGN